MKFKFRFLNGAKRKINKRNAHIPSQRFLWSIYRWRTCVPKSNYLFLTWVNNPGKVTTPMWIWVSFSVKCIEWICHSVLMRCSWIKWVKPLEKCWHIFNINTYWLLILLPEVKLLRLLLQVCPLSKEYNIRTWPFRVMI